MYMCMCVCERNSFSMSESKKSYQFLPTFREYVFIISFTFDYIPFVTEISAPREIPPLCPKNRAFAMPKTSPRPQSNESPDISAARCSVRFTAMRHVKCTSFVSSPSNSSATSRNVLDDVDHSRYVRWDE